MAETDFTPSLDLTKTLFLNIKVPIPRFTSDNISTTYD